MGQILTRPGRMRLIAVSLFALIAGGSLFYPVLVLQWYVGMLPFSPYGSRPAPRAPTGGWPRIDVSKEQYLVTWPEGRSETAAPPLSLRILPTDWYGWWSSNARHDK